MLTTTMTSPEKRAVFSLAGIFALRMFGLFMILPVFSLYAQHLTHATPLLIGVAMGCYGLTQALLQIPLGMLSDRLGRHIIIIAGLIVFIIGSIVAALSDSITGVIIGRALQGAGAIGSTLMALTADLTQEQHRTFAMAIIGMTIGLSFAGAMILGPVLNTWFSVPGLFWITALLGGIAILLLIRIPKPAAITWHADTEPEINQLFNMLKQPELLRLDLGVFLLHAALTATFVVIPIHLAKIIGIPANHQGYIYLPVLGFAFLFTLLLIMTAEKKQILKPCFLLAIVGLGLAEFAFWLGSSHLTMMILSLFVFFTVFSFLEASLPALISKASPANRKGTALGIYSCCQFLGIFVGGSIGGWLYGFYGLLSVYLFCVLAALLWLLIAFRMNNPRYSHQAHPTHTPNSPNNPS